MKLQFLVLLCLSMTTSAFAQTKAKKEVTETIESDSESEQVPRTRKKNTGLIGSSVDKNNQGPAYGMAGCGLGSVLFGESDNRGGQILASTTNGVYGNATFGMSSGTSNCVPDPGMTAQMKKNMDMFVVANRESLANDIAKSNGETVLAISNIMGCRDTNYLGAKLQSQYEVIFNSQEESKISDNMWATVTTDRYLVENCKI